MDYIKKHIANTTLSRISKESVDIIKGIQDIAKEDLKISFQESHDVVDAVNVDMSKMYNIMMLTIIQLATKAAYTSTDEYMVYTIENVRKNMQSLYDNKMLRTKKSNNLAIFLIWYHMIKRKTNSYTSVAVDPTTAILTAVDDIIMASLDSNKIYPFPQ